jgi:hypothetical protein
MSRSSVMALRSRVRALPINDITCKILSEREIINEIGYLLGPTVVGEVSQGVISLLYDPGLNYQTRSKHIRICYAFI